VRGRFAKSLIAVLLIVSLGGHWAFLQSLAWASMVIDYSKDAPLSVAVSKTFDGKNPCNLCHLVKRGQESEQKQEATKVKTKLDFCILARSIEFQIQAGASQQFLSLQNSFAGHVESPPIPPPRPA
jgi:hypothetical protein